MTRRSRTPGLLVLAAAMGLLVAGQAAASRWKLAYDGQDTRCLPWAWYLIDLRDQTPARGELVAFLSRQSAPHFPVGTAFVKRVAGVPGDAVAREGHTLLIAGAPVATLDRRILERIGAPTAAARYTVPPAALVVLGETELSFDSRYWGPIDADQVVGVARGLW